jgi:hypothetical protein
MLTLVVAAAAILGDVVAEQARAASGLETKVGAAQSLLGSDGMFVHRFAATDGLGPDFNAPSCVTCHSTPIVGGTSSELVDWIYDGQSDRLGRPSQLHPRSARDHSAEVDRREAPPSAAISSWTWAAGSRADRVDSRARGSERR